MVSGRTQQPGFWTLDDALADTVRRTGASAGGIYLLDETEAILSLVVICGIPADVAWPWRRVPLNAPVPVGDAIREDRLVWVGSQDHMARAYPRAAASLPYRFALAATPLRDSGRCRGALMLLWPASHPPGATARERGNIASAGRRIARLLDEAPVPTAVPEHPRIVPVGAVVRPQGSQSPQAAADYIERLPETALGLDLQGRITFLAAATESLLGVDAGRLLGTRPWQSLPWLDKTHIEDHYRTAVISRDPVTFTALRPPTPGCDSSSTRTPAASVSASRPPRHPSRTRSRHPRHHDPSAPPHRALRRSDACTNWYIWQPRSPRRSPCGTSSN